MSDLCVPKDVQDHLGIGSVDTSLLQSWVDIIDGLMSEMTGQQFLKGTTSSPVVLEPVDGTGRVWIWVARPISVLTTVLVGQDKNNPSETLTVSDPTTVVVHPRRPRRIQRTDGSIFPAGIANVFVSYTPADNLPAMAKGALIEAVTFVYRRRGSEDADSESEGGFSHKLLQDLDKLPIWHAFMGRYRKPNIAMFGGGGGPQEAGTLWPYGVRFTP